MNLKTKEYRLYLFEIILWHSAPTVTAIAALGAYQYFTETLTTSSMLMVLTLFYMLRKPLDVIPMAVFGISEIVVSMKRITVRIKLNKRGSCIRKK